MKFCEAKLEGSVEYFFARHPLIIPGSYNIGTISKGIGDDIIAAWYLAKKYFSPTRQKNCTIYVYLNLIWPKLCRKLVKTVKEKLTKVRFEPSIIKPELWHVTITPQRSGIKIAETVCSIFTQLETKITFHNQS